MLKKALTPPPPPWPSTEEPGKGPTDSLTPPASVREAGAGGGFEQRADAGEGRENGGDGLARGHGRQAGAHVLEHEQRAVGLGGQAGQVDEGHGRDPGAAGALAAGGEGVGEGGDGEDGRLGVAAVGGRPAVEQGDERLG